MKRENIKDILIYYRNIPEMIEHERKWCKYIEDAYYNGIKSPNVDGMPRKRADGSQVEAMGILAAEADASGEQEKIFVRIETMKRDRDIIQECLDGLNGVNKRVLYERYVCRYSWVKISNRLHRPESTIRSWHDRALDRFGSNLENDVLMLDELVSRASRAR